MGRGLKAQMKYADKIEADYVIVLGDNELVTETAKLKNMKTGEQTDIKIDRSFVKTFSDIYFADVMSVDAIKSMMKDFSGEKYRKCF